MKKTIKINVSGIIFFIDEDAYELLQDYLTDINSHFSSHEEGREIIADIEARIAELLQTKTTEDKEVINMEDIHDIIKIMGDPKDFAEANGVNGDATDPERVYQNRRRLYRDPDNAVIAGVSGGLGAYFNIDPIWFRIIFIILAIYGVGILVYIILWIVLPKALTTAQKLEMKGEKVTVTNIEKSVREEYIKVKERVQEIPNSSAYKKTQTGIENFFQAMGQVLVAIIKFLLAVVGIVLIVAGFSVLLGLTGMLIFQFDGFSWWGHDWSTFAIPEFLGLFADPRNVPLILVCLFFVLTIPLIGTIYAGFKLIFRFRTKDRVLGITAFVLWIICAFALATFVMAEANEYKTSGRYNDNILMDEITADTLYLKIADDGYWEGLYDDWFFDEEPPFVYNATEEKLYGRMRFDIQLSSSESFEIELEKEARGATRQAAINNARQIDYQYFLTDSLLMLHPYYTLDKGGKWRAAELDVTLKIPVGKVIYIGSGMEDILHNVKNTEDAWSWELTEKFWRMTPEGLTSLK